MSDDILSCCSTADLSKEHFDSRGIHYVCFHFTLNNKQYPDDLGQSVPFHDFYRAIASGAESHTSQVNIEEFIRFFTPFLEQGKDVLHVSLSSGISGSYNSACSAAEMLREQFPDRRVYVVDSLGASSGYGLLMDKLADLRDGGMCLEELRDWALANRLRLHHWFFSTDLSFYVKGGRISRAAGTVATVLGICPLLHMDEPGHLVPVEKIRSKKRVIAAIVDRMREYADDGLDYSGKCYISNSDCPEDARAVARQLGQLTDKLFTATEKLERDLAKVPADAKKAMAFCHASLVPDMEKARALADQLEPLMPREAWPFPVYSDLLFSV